MGSYPAKNVIIPIVPRTTFCGCEERPGRRTRPHVHHDPCQGRVLLALDLGMICLPDIREKPLPRRIANGQIREGIVPRVRFERVGDELPKGMAGLSAENVVAQGAMPAVGGPGRIVKERLEIGTAALS